MDYETMLPTLAGEYAKARVEAGKHKGLLPSAVDAKLRKAHEKGADIDVMIEAVRELAGADHDEPAPAKKPVQAKADPAPVKKGAPK